MEDLVAAGIGAVFLVVLSVAGIVAARIIYNRKNPLPTIEERTAYWQGELDKANKQLEG